MEFRDWDPGNQWRSGDYGWLRRFSSNEIEGSRQIGDTYQLDIGQILVRTIQRWMFMVIRFGLRNIRFRGSHFKESDDGIVWIVRWISFNSRSQESSEGIGMWKQYKNRGGGRIFSYITFSSFLALPIDKKLESGVVWIIMTQGQLLETGGAMKEGESTRKRLKISVPHFDNSALIKTYARTLIGRCMNPAEQEMPA
ncbi:unnamed protein product, partial [Brassica rapa subsp. narinosa]